MSSPARVLANQENAQHSTGPTSETGKQTSSQNSRTHGLTAATPATLSPEWRAEYELLLAECIREHRPGNKTEYSYFEEFVHARFLLSKALERELATLELVLTNPQSPEADLALSLAQRYVSTLTRRSDKAFRQFQQLQKNRLTNAEISKQASEVLNNPIDIPAGIPFEDILARGPLPNSAAPRAAKLYLVATAPAILQNEPNNTPDQTMRAEAIG